MVHAMDWSGAISYQHLVVVAMVGRETYIISHNDDSKTIIGSESIQVEQGA